MKFLICGIDFAVPSLHSSIPTGLNVTLLLIVFFPFRHQIFSALISDILCPEMTEQMTCFLLPSLAETSSQFPFGFLLESLLILLSKADSSGASNFRVTPSPWLLFGVLAFVDKNLGNYFVSSVKESRRLNCFSPCRP